MNFLKFYKLYDWMLAEMGASADAVLVSIIFSFSEHKQECRLSYSQIADILKVSRCNAISRIKKLNAAGYITITSKDRETNVYTVNVENFNSPSIENDTTPSIENDTRLVSKSIPPSIENDTTPSIENDTTPSIENDTQIENINIKETENETERVREGGGESFSAEPAEQPKTAAPTPTPTYFLIPDFPDIRITKQEYDYLRYRFDYSTVKNGKTLEAFFCILESKLSEGKQYNSHYQKIREMIMQDGGKLLDEQAIPQTHFIDKYVGAESDDTSSYPKETYRHGEQFDKIWGEYPVEKREGYEFVPPGVEREIVENSCNVLISLENYLNEQKNNPDYPNCLMTAYTFFVSEWKTLQVYYSELPF